MTTPELLNQLGNLSEAIARQAGQLIVERLRNGVTVADTKSTATDVVTAVDRESEALIRQLILSVRPEDSILGEEGTEVVGTSPVQWVVDPIDGTVNYLYGIPAFSISIGVQFEGQTVAGAVYDPSRDEMFTAVAGRGAFLNRAPIEVSGEGELSQALVGTGFSYGADKRVVQATVLASVLPKIRDIRRGGSAAIDLCYVACGRLDAEYEKGLNSWDYTAGLFIAAEAGALHGGLGSSAASSDFCIVAAPNLYKSFKTLLEHAVASVE